MLRTLIFEESCEINEPNYAKLRQEQQTTKKISSGLLEAVTPFYKKDDKRLEENYSPAFLLNIDIKALEKCICKSISRYFTKQLCANEYGFVTKRSVLTNRSFFLKHF